jgi:hypothetical protein
MKLMTDRLTIDIDDLRPVLERLAKKHERTLSQQIRLFIRQGVELMGESDESDSENDQPRLGDCTIATEVKEIIKKVLTGKKLNNIESDKLKEYFDID